MVSTSIDGHPNWCPCNLCIAHRKAEVESVSRLKAEAAARVARDAAKVEAARVARAVDAQKAFLAERAARLAAKSKRRENNLAARAAASQARKRK